MTKGIIAKFTIAVILGIVSAHFWSIGEQRLAIFMIATTVFHIFFILGETKENPMYRFDIKSETPFAAEMKKYKKTKIFKE